MEVQANGASMDIRVYILLFLLVQTALGQHGWFSFAEGFSSNGAETTIELSYRSHTAPSLQELKNSGIVVDRLEIMPHRISTRVGDAVHLDQIRVTAFDNHNRIVQRVPLSFIIEGPSDLLDFEAFITYGEKIKAVAPGSARIWVGSLLPTSSGGNVREQITLTVE